MKTDIKKRIAIYQFQDNRKLVGAIPLGNLILILCFIMGNEGFSNPHVLMSLLTAVLFFKMCKINDWQSTIFNLFVVFIYLLFLVIEFNYVGIPKNTIELSQSISKGIILELFAALLPYTYFGIKILLMIPLIQMTIISRKMKISGFL